MEPIGEIELQAFYYGNLGLRHAALIAAMSVPYQLSVTGLDRHKLGELLHRVRAAYHRGKNSRELLSVRFDELWDRPVSELSQLLCPPAASEAAWAGPPRRVRCGPRTPDPRGSVGASRCADRAVPLPFSPGPTAMTDPLVLCSACSRHIRACERACPFCAAAQPSTPVISPHVTSPTVARVASVALVAGLALAAGCVEVAHAQSRTPPAIPGPVPAYGVAPPPSMFRDAGTNPPGQSVADAGHHDAGTHHHDGGTRRRDAGVVTAPPQDPGAVHAMYGVPPAPGTIRRR